VLFADIRNFTRAAAALPAERVVALLDDYFDVMTAAAAAHGAMVDKLIGDAVMVVFGIPHAQGTEAQRALYTADAMHRSFQALLGRWRRSLPASLRLGLGIGCASGDAVLANVGSSARMDYTLIGAPVNLAARLTAAAGDGVTLVSNAVRDAVRGTLGSSIRFGPARRLAVKGIRGPVLAYAAWLAANRPMSEPRVSVSDPVCGMKLPATSSLRAIYRQKTYYFCSPPCRAAFRRNPARYAFGPRGRGARKP
jgi:class 3 adenylate cyclase/YHS domain-containing protein